MGAFHHVLLSTSLLSFPVLCVIYICLAQVKTNGLHDILLVIFVELWRRAVLALVAME